MQTTPHDIEQARALRDNELESVKITQQKLWVTVWGLGTLLTVAVIGNTWQALSKPLPIMRYVEVDRASLTARVIDPAAERYEPSQDIAKGTLEGYIKTLRRKSKDSQRDKDDWNALKVCMTPNARKRLQTYEQEGDTPQKQKYPRDVQIVTRLFKTTRTYDFRWQEWRYGQDGQQDGPTVFYSASLTFERRDPRTDQEVQHCPTGIFLDTWTLGKDQ